MTAGEAGPLAEGKRCCVCGSRADVHLTTAPVCPDHASPVALERSLAEARAALEAVLTALEWMDSWGRDAAGMAQARTLHYDLTGKAATLLPLVRAALARGGGGA